MPQPANPELVDSLTQLSQVLGERVDGNTIKQCRVRVILDIAVTLPFLLASIFFG